MNSQAKFRLTRHNRSADVQPHPLHSPSSIMSLNSFESPKESLTEPRSTSSPESADGIFRALLRKQAREVEEMAQKIAELTRGTMALFIEIERMNMGLSQLKSVVSNPTLASKLF